MKHRIAVTTIGAAAAVAATAVGAGGAAAAPTSASGSSGWVCPAVPRNQVNTAVRRLPPPFPGRDIAWRVSDSGSSMDCSLNWVQVFPEGATGSSPTQILFFDHHRFVNTATARPTAFTHVVGSLWPGEVTVQFRWLIGDDPTANPRGRADVHYQLLPFLPPFPIEQIPPQAFGG